MKKKHRLIITAQAEINISDAFEYYEYNQPHVGEYFLSVLEKCFLSIETNPEIYKIAFSNFRQAKVPKFPFVVIYKVELNEIIVAKVFHTYRNPIKKIK
ncbi:hypothetical protein CHU92_06905 [Flavobacterium cyanobacteriorum]|uniref:Plasmid stabilization system n=1 Tax=Flavobacterium cyanobacteriorum TaxID=2022802 RepID=A0A255ZAY6_9FLAO|nr:type II toxin-antitoxin system RelE/ParE family toxin [Flavobacterium cyanobacteriorum]OYQ38025.1 hypothetical protein CHU92_06905 [Flavobacterium cyanobacteriorum]